MNKLKMLSVSHYFTIRLWYTIKALSCVVALYYRGRKPGHDEKESEYPMATQICFGDDTFSLHFSPLLPPDTDRWN